MARFPVGIKIFFREDCSRKKVERRNRLCPILSFKVNDSFKNSFDAEHKTLASADASRLEVKTKKKEEACIELIYVDGIDIFDRTVNS